VVPVLGGVVQDFGVLASEWEEGYFVTISSRDFCYHWVPAMRVLRLLM